MPKASDNIKIYRNPNGPVVSTVNRRVLEQDGLIFKDIDGTGTLSPVNDWRNSPAERAAAYVKTLSVKEKIAQLFISDWRMAKYPITGPMADLYKDIEKKTDETGILDEGEFRGKTIFGEQYLPGTSPLLKDWFNRHVILRANATPADLADWMNQADAVCEECEHFIPVAAASNSRNENGELVFGMNDAGGVLATWPGTLGIAAAVKGSKIDLVDKFADTIRREWNACGLRKGYMYMADAVTDPRWQRTYGTFGEDPALISEIMAHIIPRIQGSDHGVTEDGVAVTTKHFPGGGARENGFIQNLLGHPGVRQRSILERLAILGRGTVRDVRVPHMHMQEPVFGIALAVQPVQRYRDHLVGRFQAALADVVGFVKAAVEPPRCVAVREAADAGGFHARAAQYGGQVVAAIEIGHAAVAALPTHFSVHSAVAYAAGVDTKPAGHQSGAARQAGSIGTIYIGKAHRIFGHFINIGAGGTRITIAAQVVWAQGVDIYIQNPHGNIPFYSYYLL